MNSFLKIADRQHKSVAGVINGRLLPACLIVFFFLSFSYKAKAQQDFINGFYMFNPLEFNPAVAGVNDQMIMSGIARTQWTGLNGAPNTQYFNFHMPVFSWFDRYDRLGSIDYPTGLSAGLMLLNDNIGATNYSRFSIPIATRIRLTRSGIRLSLGLRVDGSRFSQNIDDLRGDPESYLQDPNYFVDFSTGLYAYHERWYAGVSMTNMRGVDMTDEYGYEFVHHYFAMAGYAHPVNDDLVLRVTTLATVVVGTPFSMTITPAVIIKNNIETGLSYRYDDMFGAFFTFNVFKNLKVGYWYEYPMGVKVNQVGATHEIVLQLEFDRFKKQVVSPRYFW